MALIGRRQSKGDTKEPILISFGPLSPKDAEQKINHLKASVVVTMTTTVEVVIVLILYERNERLKRGYQTDLRLINIINSFKQHEKECFYNIICRLAIVRTQGHSLNRLELSNQLLQKGYGCLGDLNLFGLIDTRTEHQQLDYGDESFCFIHTHVQHFLAAVNLLSLPLMEIFQFLKNFALAEHIPEIAENSSIVLQFFFGLASSIFGDNSTALLQNVIKFLTQHINRDAPVIDSRVSILILNCLYESLNRADNTSIPTALYKQAQNESFVRHIFSYDASVIEENVNAFAYYLANTSEPKQTTWTIYCSNKQKIASLSKKITELRATVNIKTGTKLTPSDSKRIVISNRNYDYLVSVLSDVVAVDSSLPSSTTTSFGRTDSKVSSTSSYPENSMLSLSSVSVDTQYTYSSPAHTSDCLSGPYGYLTKEQFESEKKVHTTFYYNVVKDFVTPNLQMHCATLVRNQYRKNDHIWFSFPPTMRHSFYECVQITPVVPMHWVKVPQPDGSVELEEKFREKALTYQVAVPPASNEVAELVVLNSHRLERIAITPPSGGDPVFISLYRNSELSDNGEIGCDYLMQYHQIQEEVKWKKANTFNVGNDEQIGRELPLPSKKGTESAEITTSTAMANLKETAGAAGPQLPVAKPGPREQILGSSKLFARPLDEGPDIQVSEQQIKRWAMEGFDRPGFCFYGDGNLFQMGYEYTLPEQLPHTRTLREGGNGTVLEVFYEGTFYAVKRTAFRWREVLIMPKLKHRNILRLMTMLMGPPMKEYPRRRYVFQYFPRMSNDLGRSIGSYERYCLRTLKERYRNEPLLLSRILENFKYVAREILEALNYLHTLPSPIVHRDVKPSNVLVKTECNCNNPLVCVCRVRPWIVISDFDASLELSPEGDLIPDSTHSRSQSYYTTQERLYHISPVGTMGFKSPEGFMHVVSNSLEVLPQLSTKADIFSFGLLMTLLFLNEDGPRHLSQVGTLLLSMNQTVDRRGRLSQAKLDMLKKHSVNPHTVNFTVTDKDVEKVLPIKRLKKDFSDMPDLVDFIERALTIDPKKRPSARDLLKDVYLVSSS